MLVATPALSEVKWTESASAVCPEAPHVPSTLLRKLSPPFAARPSTGLPAFPRNLEQAGPPRLLRRPSPRAGRQACRQYHVQSGCRARPAALVRQSSRLLPLSQLILQHS